jgi:ribose transport system ATP-binding protein
VVRGVNKTFGATRAVADVDIALRRGEVHAFVGQNGCGKSTLIKLLAGFHGPDAPVRVDCHGREFDLGDAAAAHENGLRFVHQDLGVVTALNTMDNLALGFGYPCARGRRIRWRVQQREAEEALKRLGYRFDVRAPLAHLAPVEQTAVAIARALQGIEPNSSVLVLDEPTATMPRAEVRRMFDIVRSLREQGVSVLYVSHHLDEVYAIADRITVMRDGKVVATRTTADLPRRELVELMIGSEVREETSTAPELGGDVALEITGLSTLTLHGVDLELRAGEIVGVAGLTGSGREHLCDAVFGGIRRRGIVAVQGKHIEAMRPDLMVEHHVGLVPANRREAGIFETMSVRENFTSPNVSQYWSGLIFRHRAERRDVTSLAEKLKVSMPGTEAGIDALSGGNQQKVVVGRWLRLEPTVLLLDDPTQGVDIGAKADIHHLIEVAAANGAAVLVCSTDEAELERISHRVLVLRDGRVAARLARGEATATRIAHETLGVADPAGTPPGRTVTV